MDIFFLFKANEKENLRNQICCLLIILDSQAKFFIYKIYYYIRFSSIDPVCVRACVRACVCVCVRACVSLSFSPSLGTVRSSMVVPITSKLSLSNAFRNHSNVCAFYFLICTYYLRIYIIFQPWWKNSEMHAERRSTTVKTTNTV